MRVRERRDAQPVLQKGQEQVEGRRSSGVCAWPTLLERLLGHWTGGSGQVVPLTGVNGPAAPP